MKTKTNLLKAALKLFNENGMVNVRLQHIADEAGKSVGNLAYHFTNKEAISMALYNQLETEQEELQKEFRIVPLFDNIDRLLGAVFNHQLRYRFFYLDTLEVTRAYPTIQAAYARYSASEIQQWEHILQFNVSRGALRTEPRPGFFPPHAIHWWATTTGWLAQETLRNQEKYEVGSYKKAVWNLFIPLFTNLGHQEYNQMLQSPYDLFY